MLTREPKSSPGAKNKRFRNKTKQSFQSLTNAPLILISEHWGYLCAWVRCKRIRTPLNSPFCLCFDCNCFFSAWFLHSVSCPVSPWPCAALRRCPERCLSSGPLTRTSEHFTAFMAHTSLPVRWHFFSGHLRFPFKEKKAWWWSIYSSQWERLTLTMTSVSCNSLRANINWVWTSMKDTANSHFIVCIWKILGGAGSWSESMLVLAQNTTRVPDFALFLFRGPSRLS